MNATRKWHFRWLRGVLIVGALAAIAVLAAVAFMQTPPGKRVLASAAGGFLSRMTGQVWQLEGLGGTVPFDLSLDRIRWSDHDGPILSIDSAHVGLSVGGLLRGTIHATDVSAERVALQRLPKSKEGQRETVNACATSGNAAFRSAGPSCDRSSRPGGNGTWRRCGILSRRRVEDAIGDGRSGIDAERGGIGRYPGPGGPAD